MEKIDKKALEGFQKLLNKAPESKSIKKRYDGIEYLPISYYEAQLDRLFFGLWSTEVIEAKQVLNEVICVVKLTYTHPVTETSFCKTGVASVQIQQKSKTPITELPLYKIPNALETCLPKAKAEAVKNAAKQLGKIFGRDLSRKDDQVTEYSPLMGDRVSLDRAGLLMLVEGEINSQTSLKELNAYMRSNIEYLSDKDIQRIFQNRTQDLKQISLPAQSVNDDK